MTFNHHSIGFWLTRRAELTPHRVAIDFEDRRITYEELNARANRAAHALAALGVTRGDRVAVLAENCPEYVEIFFACAKSGFVLAPVSHRLSEEEMAWQINDSQPKGIIASREWEATARGLIRAESQFLWSLGTPGVSIDQKNSDYEQALDEQPATEPEDTNASDDPVMILYTSGTTGRPKGAVLTHGNFFWANLNILVNADVSHDEVSLMFLPMFHIGGWNVNTLVVFLKGGTVVLERAFNAERILELIPRKKVTMIMGVPATYLFMSQAPGFANADLSTVRLMIVGGAPMPEPLLRTYAARGIDIVQGYGLTELAPNALILPMDEAQTRLGSAGKPYFFTDTHLMDESGALLGPGSTGEIVASGPVVMQGYWKRDDATSETVRDGWLHTGDIGRMDADGFVWVVDRTKDMIITGGENVYPAEIENVLYALDEVSEVAVIGVPDVRWGESILAIVVAKAGREVTEADVIGHCHKHLGRFKVPRQVEIRSEPLPRTPAGKVRKSELRAPYWEGQEKKV